MTSISSISTSGLATSQADEILRQQQLRAAITDAVKPQLDQAVQTGAVTSTQAKDLLAKLTSGDSATPAAQNVRGHGGHHGHRGMGKVVQSGEDAAAKALGMTSADLKTALQSGQTLKDVAASKNVDFSKVQSAISDAVKPELDQAVKTGRLTGTQEQDLLSKLTSGDNSTQSSGPTYSTSGSVSQAPDPGLLVNSTA